MKKILNKKLNILEIVLLLSPIIDILTSISQRTFNIDISLGLIIRSFLLFFMCMFMLIKSKYKNRKATIIYFCIILLYFAAFIINTFLSKENGYIVSEVKELIKAFYFPICIITILNYIETKEYRININILFIVIMEYILFLFIPSILNIGYESYVQDKIGTIGWFYSANEISAIYSILIALIIFSYKYIKNTMLYLVVVVCSLFTILQIGTKLPAAAAIISITSYVIVKILQFIITKDREYTKSIGIGVLIGFIFIMIFINSPVLKNFDIYKDYLIKTRQTQLVDSNSIEEKIQNNEVDKSSDNISDNKIVSNENVVEKLSEESSEKIVIDESQNQNNTNIEEQSLTDNEIATIIHSGRAETKQEVQEAFDNLPALNKIIGLGQMNSNDNSQYLIEMDYFDILFNYGYLGFIIYFSPLIVLIVLICKRSLSKGIKQIICDDGICCFAIIIINGLLCAVAGHTFVAPAVSIYISMALIRLYKQLE